MAYPEQLQGYMEKYRKLCKEGSGKELPLAVTEYNIGSSSNEPLPYRFSFTAGLLCADMMRLWLDPANNVTNAEYWQVQNGWWGMYDTREGNITKKRAPLPFYQLWGQHFGTEMLKTEVKNSPRFDSPATSGIVAARGDSLSDSQKVADIPIPSFNFKSIKALGVEASSEESDSATFKFKDFPKEAYPEFASFKRPSEATAGIAWTYLFNFEARFTPDAGTKSNAALGLGLCDLRGWKKVKSAIAISGLEKATDWQPFTGSFTTSSSCPGATMLLRVENVAGPINGTLEIRKMKIELHSSASCPAYQGLTATSSLSEDGKTLHLLVFNKSYEAKIESGIELKGFSASAGETWTVLQQDVASVDYAEPVRKSLDIEGPKDSFKLEFPAHSMTAIDFKR